MDSFKEFVRTHVLMTFIGAIVIVWLTFSMLVYSIEVSLPESNIKSLGDALWWGVVTILTVGYGDRYPVSEMARVVSVPMMLSGVLTMGVVTAKVASVFLQELFLKRSLRMNKKLNDHIIICGWKIDMLNVLETIIYYNPDVPVERMVLMAELSEETIEDIITEPTFAKINIVSGQPHHIKSWEHVNAQHARKILVLADQSKDSNGNRPSPHEADAKTIMTAHTIQKLAVGTMVTAEILDSSLEEQLHMAGVSDIIFSKEYNKLLLGNASGGTGINNVIYDLVNPTYGSIISTIKIDESYLGRDYLDFKTDVEHKMPYLQIIGLLENTGNIHTLKQRAVKKAQNSPNIKTLVTNLQHLNKLKCNEPKFHLQDDYKVPENALAIVIEKAEAHAEMKS